MTNFAAERREFLEAATRPIIRIIEQEYEIPQLRRERRIAALLPHDYETSDLSYPVLYLQDGQNLFDEHAPYGNWAIDQALSDLSAEGLGDVIVITIDHGGEERINEYSPYYHPRFGRGQGGDYLDFIKFTLKPYVDKTFRVIPDRANTGIGGSSLGGLISLYAGFRESAIFGKMMVFSPSLWVSPKVFYQAQSYLPDQETWLYLYAGGRESSYHIPNVLRLKGALLKRSFDYRHLHFKLNINQEGTHSEMYWREEFPRALKWLYFNNQPTDEAEDIK
ncbi:MAG: alpha/beta hydrolase-fold protein [Bacteroidota bacterium]